MTDIDTDNVYSKLDEIINTVNRYKREPAFSSEVMARKKRTPNTVQNDSDALRIFARLIAVSQNAPSDLVSKMMDDGGFRNVFGNFNVDIVAAMDYDKIIAQCWKDIKVIRFPKKVKWIIECAMSLQALRREYNSFSQLLNSSLIPVHILTNEDIQAFWQGFHSLRYELADADMPFFSQPTSLLHFLLTIGYDCIKPDLIVMRVAKNVGIVPSDKGERNLLRTVKAIQKYSVVKDMRPSIVDLYLLIYGGQRWAKQFVNSTMYERIEQSAAIGMGNGFT